MMKVETMDKPSLLYVLHRLIADGKTTRKEILGLVAEPHKKAAKKGHKDG